MSSIIDVPSVEIVETQRAKKSKRVGPDGKMMRRLCAMCTDRDFRAIKSAITERSSISHAKAFDLDNIGDMTNHSDDEINGIVLSLICQEWLEKLEKNS